MKNSTRQKATEEATTETVEVNGYPVNRALVVALDARIEALLAKHGPAWYQKWRRQWEQERGEPFGDAPGAWGPVLVSVAAGLPLMRRHPEWKPADTEDPANAPLERALDRNTRLIARLMYRGLVARGEYVPARRRLGGGQ